MKKILLTLLLLPTITYGAVTFPVNGGTGTSTKPTIGQVLVGLSNGTYAPVATSSLGFSSGSGITNLYASSTFPSFLYATTTFPNFTYATNTYMSYVYGTSTFPNFTYATNTFATFTYGTSTYSPFGYGTSTWVSLFGNQTIAGNKTFTGTTTLATTTLSIGSSTLGFTAPSLYFTNAWGGNASTTSISATTGASIVNIFSSGNASTTRLSVATGATIGALNVTGIASTTSISANIGATLANLLAPNVFSTNSTSTNFFVNGGTAGSIVFLRTGGLVSQNNANFFWDNTNNRLGIASTSPNFSITVATGSIMVSELNMSTSTNMFVSFRERNQQLIRKGSAAMSIVLTDETVGAQKKIILCNPATTGGTATFFASSSIVWASATVPTQTTSTNKCDVYSFLVTQGTTTAPVIFGTANTGF